MKSTVEQLSPTRVRINVEVPFAELEPDFQRAYKELAKQVRLPGFRPGKAPAKLLEARFGREAMLDQVVNEALPARYGQAVGRIGGAAARPARDRGHQEGVRPGAGVHRRGRRPPQDHPSGPGRADRSRWIRSRSATKTSTPNCSPCAPGSAP